jgi:DNA-binding response OmpR family regulator
LAVSSGRRKPGETALADSRVPCPDHDGPPRILIIEDDPLIAYPIDNLVSDLGYAVSGIAHSFTSARHELAKRNFDAVLLDLTLRGQDCLAIADLLLEARTPFAIVTGSNRVFEGRYKGVPLLHKPFAAYQLCVLLERLVGPARWAQREMAGAGFDGGPRTPG